MKRSFPLFLAAIIMPSAAVIIVTSSISLATSRASLDETKIAEAYSCAFVSGQYDVMNELPTLFKEHKDVPAYCAEFKAIAAKHGFRHLQ